MPDKYEEFLEYMAELESDYDEYLEFIKEEKYVIEE